ncbi:MAG: sigma-70 family RNA polymerase sigma factor [Prevotella sp.]|nr:sigma-70 family RNA polymerase sigma factor [Prevotella sp.]
MDERDEQKISQLLSDRATQRKGFELMVRQYSEQLYWLIRRIVLTHEDANDVLQNTFLKAWNGIDFFHGDSKISTWLSRIAINESLDFLRRNKHQSVSMEEIPIANSLMADNYFDGSEAEAMLQEAIASLPDVQRTVFLLRYFDEKKYSEISQLLNTSEGALKASYHIAVKKISEFFRARD